MKNEQTLPKPQWETPGMTILAVNEVTLGGGAAGTDFGSEISAP